MVFVNANMVPSLIQWVRRIWPASQSLRNFAYCICTGVFLALYSFSGKICPVLGTSNQDSNLNEIYQFLQSLYVFSLPSYNMTKVLPNSLKVSHLQSHFKNGHLRENSPNVFKIAGNFLPHFLLCHYLPIMYQRKCTPPLQPFESAQIIRPCSWLSCF